MRRRCWRGGRRVASQQYDRQRLPGNRKIPHFLSSSSSQFLVPPTPGYSGPDYFVERGDPAQRILELAELRNADLILLGAQPERGIAGMATHLPIAIAPKVVSHAKCPVLTIRSE